MFDQRAEHNNHKDKLINDTKYPQSMDSEMRRLYLWKDWIKSLVQNFQVTNYKTPKEGQRLQQPKDYN